jgi:hypothetical protein
VEANMKEKEKNDNLNSTADDEYFKLLGNKGYEIFNPPINSQEKNVLDGLSSIIKNFLGPQVLDIDIKVKIYLINNAMINAAVCKRGNTYYISLFRGVITDLKDFVLNFIMNNFPYDFFQKQFGKLYENQTSVFEFFKECDCEHYQLANNIANNILFLIVYHEMGHIFSGHQEKINAEYEFFMEASQDKGGNMLTQARELMADFFSMINALGVYDYNHHESLEEYAFNHCCYLISLYSLYIYFEKNNYKNKEENTFGIYEELFERSHPHPAIRLLYMMDFLDAETEHELKELFKVNWLTKDNETEILKQINGASYCAICEFSLKLSYDFRLVNKIYENRSLRIRQLVQNIASDLYEETYREVAIIKLQGIGRIADGYVDEVLQANELLGKYDAIEKDS